MNIAKYKDKWRCQVYKNGIRKSGTFATKTEASDWGKRTEIELSDAKAELGFTFGDACDKYIAEVSSKKDGEKWEVNRIEALRTFFGTATLLAEISAPQIAAWRDDRLAKVTGGTVLREKNVLNNIFTVARDEWHWCEHYPFNGVKMPQENEEREAVWRWQQIKQVLRAPVNGKTKEVVDAFHIALRTSLRLQEVLTAPTIFDKKRQVCVVPPKFNKTKRTETVPVGRIAAKLLQRPAFKVKPNEASTLFADLTGRLGIDGLTFHDTRASALTYLSRKVDVMRLAKISRHKDIRILQRRYYRERPEDISKVL